VDIKAGLTVGLLTSLIFSLGGCASLKSIPLDPAFWQLEGKRVGVALMVYPPAETIVDANTINSFAGSRQYVFGGVLQSPEMDIEPMRFSETKHLRDATEELNATGFSSVQDLFISGLRDKGFAAIKLDKPIEKKQLPRFKGESKNGPFASRDYRDRARGAAVDYLIVIELENYGVYCHYIDLYNDYVEARAHARAELVDAATNRIIWRTGWSQGDFRKEVNASCSRPDQIPVIVDALNGLLTDAASSLSRDFFSPQVKEATTATGQ
jgi:hypothetical protein